jgi:hypothetical protein
MDKSTGINPLCPADVTLLIVKLVFSFLDKDSPVAIANKLLPNRPCNSQ